MGKNTRDSKEDRKARKAQAAAARAAADPHANVTTYVTKRLADTTKEERDAAGVSTITACHDCDEKVVISAADLTWLRHKTAINVTCTVCTPDFPTSNGLVADDGGVAVATYIAPDGTVTETMTFETDGDMDLVFSWNPDDI